MTKTNALFIIVYGIIVAVGGLMGYLKAGSLPSLIMGSAFGLLLIASGWLALQQNSIAYALCLVLSGVLTLFFGYRFYLTGAIMPAGVMSMLSLIAFAYTFFAKR